MSHHTSGHVSGYPIYRAPWVRPVNVSLLIVGWFLGMLWGIAVVAGVSGFLFGMLWGYWGGTAEAESEAELARRKGGEG